MEVIFALYLVLIAKPRLEENNIVQKFTDPQECAAIAQSLQTIADTVKYKYVCEPLFIEKKSPDVETLTMGLEK